ncbi:hypothetical protein E2C01_032956 [Portunus trituberculatus]|uniref:Uncharacterized protein n=1 Tax=Portunus trituberculatus TaxID=210409 RepID=A0A5B7EWJ8_PORTR|nr:hypothetical protein [Portunus trituberculatus]
MECVAPSALVRCGGAAHGPNALNSLCRIRDGTAVPALSGPCCDLTGTSERGALSLFQKLTSSTLESISV